MDNNGCSGNGIWINNIDEVEPYKTNFDLHNCAASSGGLGVVITCSKIP